MKTSNKLTAIKVATIVVTAFAATAGYSIAQGNGQGNGNSNKKLPAAPVGWLNAYPTVVQTGTKPQLTWGTTYPAQVLDYIEIIEPATIKLKRKLDVQVRVLGAGVTAHSKNSNQFWWVNTEALISYKGSSYSRIFYGKNPSVNPSKVVWSRKKNQTNKYDTIRFGGRYNYYGWGPLYTSTTNGSNVRTLVNGDTPPGIVPMHQAPSLEEFIKPYLDAQGKVKIGPMDVIVFMELTHNDNQQNHPGYDLQDMVLLVTFTENKPKNNNGHGNNADGVDSSNPGKAPFMQYDSDPNVDDENGGGGAAPSNP